MGLVAGEVVHEQLEDCYEDGPMAPQCPPAARGPITLEVLQGAWVGSSGSSIAVIGTEVFINGLPLNGHRVELDDNGNVVSIGRLWQLMGWTESGGVDFRCSSTRENMECA